jgi:ribosomal protein L11 methyltransferase
MWRRLTLEARAREAGAAGALLAGIAGGQLAIEQREGDSKFAASAYVPNKRAARALRALRAGLRTLQSDGILRTAVVRHASVRDEDWSQTWKRHFRPFRAAKELDVVPSWEAKSRTRGTHVLLLDPGMAFGTGQHATTRLALALLLKLIEPRDVLIDAGSGSGILGIAAAMRGASVYAFDEDPVAVAASRRNFKRNGARATIAKADRIPRAFPKADMIVANLTGELLQGLAAHLAAHLKRGGRLVTSGITARSRLATLFAFSRAGLTFVQERRRGEWFAYVHVRGPSSRARRRA